MVELLVCDETKVTKPTSRRLCAPDAHQNYRASDICADSRAPADAIGARRLLMTQVRSLFRGFSIRLRKPDDLITPATKTRRHLLAALYPVGRRIEPEVPALAKCIPVT